MAEKADSEYTADLAETMYKDSLRQKNTDFKIVIGNVYIYCHIVVLCAASEYFDALISSGVRTANLDEYIVSKDGEIVQAIVKFLYLGTIELTSNSVLNVLRAATFLKLTKLIAKCETFMASTLSLETFLSYFTAVAKFGLHDLEAACQEFGVRNFSALAATPWFIPSLTLQQLADYLAHDARQVAREDDALDAVRTWLEVKPHTEDDADTLMQHVRLSSCDPRRLKELQKDKSVPWALRMKLFEFQSEGGKDGGVKKRTGASTASSSRAGASAEKKVVLVGGRVAENKATDRISYLNTKHENTPITTAEGYTDLGLYSVCFGENNITISGGYSSANKESVDTINQYDTLKRQWNKLPNLRQKTSRHVSLIIKHLLYVIAGVFESPDLTFKKWYKEVWILDMLTGKWRRGADIPHAVSEAGAAVVNGHIIVAGGVDFNDLRITRTVKYDLATDKWADCTSMPKSRESAFNSTVAVGNLMYFLARHDFLEYNVTRDTWTTLTAPPMPSICSAMLLRDDHTLLALGGYEENIQKPHGRMQRYDLRTRRWSLCDESMFVPLSNHFAFLLPLPQ